MMEQRSPPLALAIAGVCMLTWTLPAGASTSVDGIWGISKDGRPDCKVLVMVLRDGAYTKAMLDVGTTQGLRDSIAGRSSYTMSGDRLEVARSLSLSRPEPRQVFRWDPVTDVLRRERPEPYLTYRRCPDRPLNPLTR